MVTIGDITFQVDKMLSRTFRKFRIKIIDEDGKTLYLINSNTGKLFKLIKFLIPNRYENTKNYLSHIETKDEYFCNMIIKTNQGFPVVKNLFRAITKMSDLMNNFGSYNIETHVVGSNIEFKNAVSKTPTSISGISLLDQVIKRHPETLGMQIDMVDIKYELSKNSVSIKFDITLK